MAAALVEMQLPALMRSLHQAVGTLVWVAVLIFALLSRRGASGVGLPRVTPPRPSLRAAEAARSTKNESSRGPAKTLRPPPRSYTPWNPS